MIYVKPSGQSLKGMWPLTPNTLQAYEHHSLPSSWVTCLYWASQSKLSNIPAGWTLVNNPKLTDCLSVSHMHTGILIRYCFGQYSCTSTRRQHIEFSQVGEIQTCQPGSKHLSTHVSPSAGRPAPDLTDSPAFVYLQWRLTLIICLLCGTLCWAEKEWDL